MKKIVFYCCLLAALGSCKKDKDSVIVEGTVQQQGGCGNMYWQVIVDNPDPEIHSFICGDDVGGPAVVAGCRYSVFIELPQNLARAGKKIQFSGTTVIPSCMSSTLAPRHIIAKMLRAK